MKECCSLVAMEDFQAEEKTSCLMVYSTTGAGYVETMRASAYIGSSRRRCGEEVIRPMIERIVVNGVNFESRQVSEVDTAVPFQGSRHPVSGFLKSTP